MSLLSSAAATVIIEPVFSLAVAAASASVVDGPCIVTTTWLEVLALVVLLVVVTAAIAVIGLVVLLLKVGVVVMAVAAVVGDVNVDDVVLSVVVFLVGRGLVEVSKWDVVM